MGASSASAAEVLCLRYVSAGTARQGTRLGSSQCARENRLASTRQNPTPRVWAARVFRAMLATTPPHTPRPTGCTVLQELRNGPIPFPPGGKASVPLLRGGGGNPSQRRALDRAAQPFMWRASLAAFRSMAGLPREGLAALPLCHLLSTLLRGRFGGPRLRAAPPSTLHHLVHLVHRKGRKLFRAILHARSALVPPRRVRSAQSESGVLTAEGHFPSSSPEYSME